MAQHLLFVTGRLAEKSLRRVLGDLPQPGFTYDIAVPGVAVAALITTEMLKRRLGEVSHYDRIVLPGRCRGDVAELSAYFGAPVVRGPEELKDLPAFFGRKSRPRNIEKTDVLLFAEVVDAPQLDMPALLERARHLRSEGADVIDLGCLPDTPFPQLEDAVTSLRAEGFSVSVDSLNPEELKRGIGAGADYCFSLTQKTLHLVAEHDCVPVLIAEDPRDLESLCDTIDAFRSTGRRFFADPVVDPIHYGFTASLGRYAELRRRYPDIDILMGVGNLSELTHCDSLGLNTLLMGVVSELGIRAVLTTQVSAHCRSVVREIDRIRRVMFAAREDNSSPRHLDESLLALHDRHPFPYSPEEIAESAKEVKDANFRIQVSSSGLHVYNRDGHQLAEDPYDLYPGLNVDDDAPHAFYLGLELGRAQIAWQLGKRYTQDEELDWGCVRPRRQDDKIRFAEERTTLKARRARRRR